MGFPLREILGIVKVGAGFFSGPGTAIAAGATAVEKILGEKGTDREQSWVSYARQLEGMKLSNETRAELLRDLIRSDLVKDEGKAPKERRVNALAELTVLAASGDLEE